MAKKSKITIHPSFEIGEISPRLFGGFLEPIGKMVNGSMYCPGHPTADDKGFRKDFMDGLREEAPTEIGGLKVLAWRDYKKDARYDLLTGEETKTGLPSSESFGSTEK